MIASITWKRKIGKRDSLERAATTASAWFPRVKTGEFRDVIFIEQAIALGRFAVLTFLYPEGGKFASENV